MTGIILKTPAEIAAMRESGKIAGHILNELREYVREGTTTLELDKRAERLITEAGAKPSFKGYNRYPNAICISVNDEVVHGVPKNRVLKNGDIVGLDLGVYYQGFHADTAATYAVGKISPEAKRLLKITKRALQEGIKRCRPGLFLGDVQWAIQKTVENAGFGVVRGLVGHGVGRELQEAPAIPNFGKPGTGPELKIGMTLALEPMVTAGDWHIKVLEDGWTVVTLDGSLSAHFEHTVAIGNRGAELLTRSTSSGSTSRDSKG